MNNIEEARDLIQKADDIFILAGSGMSVELGTRTYWSGPDAKYAQKTSRFGYTDLEHATESLWQTDLSSQLMFYNETWRKMLETPVDTENSPYKMLLDYVTRENKNYVAMTTNIDSAFVRTGFKKSKVYEVHGSYRKSQCLKEPVEHGIFDTPNPYDNYALCPTCGYYARPNVLFFDDLTFNPALTMAQLDDYSDFRLDSVRSKSVAIEVGAGETIPTIRNQSLILNKRFDTPVIRINPFKAKGVDGIAGIMGRSKTEPFIEIEANAIETLSSLLA